MFVLKMTGVNIMKMTNNKCPKCKAELSDYDDYGVNYKICKKCGWDERNEQRV